MQDAENAGNCQPFRACLEEVWRWSDSHPGHLPLFVPSETTASDGVCFRDSIKGNLPPAKLWIGGTR